MSFLLPPDRPDEESEILERIKRGERVEHYETSRLKSDGRRIDVSLTISPIRDKTARAGFCHVTPPGGKHWRLLVTEQQRTTNPEFRSNLLTKIEQLLRIGFLYPQQIIWNKGRVVLTRTHYWYQHEPCWYVRKKNAPWFGKAGENSTIWDSPSPKFIMGKSDEPKFDHPCTP
jgi:hypothetical protein